MKNIKVVVSNETHRILVNYKLENNLKTLDESIEKILKELKGGKKK